MLHLYIKRNSKLLKINYRPVSILSNISKVYERRTYDQIPSYFDKTLSRYQCGFLKGYYSQLCLIALIEKWKESVDNGGAFGALFTDLSKAFNCLSHKLLIVKLHAYGFDKISLMVIYNYLSNLKQRENINQGSILESLLFNVVICDIFYFIEDFETANYADDLTPFNAKLNHQSVVEELKILSSVLFTWLWNNYVNVNTEKSHLLLSGSN